MTQHELKLILDYNPDTGIFTWKLWRGGNAIAGSVAGHVDTRGHVQICINGKMYAAHRLAFLYMTGKFPDQLTDHVNCKKTDNRWNNLRPATPSQNCHNARRYKNNTSGFKGVSFHHGKWNGRVKKNGITHDCGHHQSPEKANQAVISKRNELHGVYARHF